MCSVLKFAPEQFVKAQRGSKGTDLLLLLTSALDWSIPLSDYFTPMKETRYPFCRGPAGPRAGLDSLVKSRSHRNSIQYFRKYRESRMGS